MPAFMNSWQTEDVASSNTGGYFKNPVSNDIINIWNVSNTIIGITNIASTPGTSTIYDVTLQLISSANTFIAHTNRLSGMEPVNSDTATLPHYDTAVSIGKMVIYLTSKSDGIQNNAPIIGNFTSLFTANDLISYYSTISPYPQTIINSMGTDESGNSVSNLTSNQINTILTDITAIKIFMDTKRTSDVNFYNNCQSIVNDFNSVKQFTNMGDTETYLLNNFIGSDKLVSRLNS